MAEESHFSSAEARRPWTLPSSLTHLFADRFQLLGRIQRGPQGTLYLGIDHEDDAEVVLKVFDRDPLDLAAAEPPLAAALLQEHPVKGTPRVVEVGVVDGHAFVATELVRGQSLAARLQEGSMSLTDALALAQTVCAVLAQAHALGVVHGDLKPRNVLFGEDDGLPWVVDFGRVVPPTLLPTLPAEEGREAVMYLAPEQLDGGAATPASDVYALGVLLYRLITGRDPYPGDSVAELLRARAAQAATPVEVAAGDVELPAVLQWLVTRAMAPDPKDRFTDAVKLGRVLETWANTTSPPPDSTAPPVTPVNGPTLEPTVERTGPHAAPPLELQHVRAWHVDLDAVAAVHEALVAAENEPTQPGLAIQAPILAPSPPTLTERPAPPPTAGRAPPYVYGMALVALVALGALGMTLLG